MSISTPLASMRSSTGTSGISISRYTRSSAGSAASFGASTRCRRRVTSAVLGGVAGRVVERDLREQDLLGALAGDIGVLDRVVAEVALGQRIHVVAAGGGVEHEALEHRVVGVAAHVDAVAAQHVQVVLAVLAELALAGVGEQRRSASQHLVAVELRRRARVVVRRAGCRRPCRARPRSSGRPGSRTARRANRSRCRTRIRRRPAACRPRRRAARA